MHLCVAAVQETDFTCEADCRVLDGDFVVFSPFGSHFMFTPLAVFAGEVDRKVDVEEVVGEVHIGEVSLLVGRSLDEIVNLVFAGDRGGLIVADVVVKTFDFQIAAVDAPNTAAERRFFFRRLGTFVDVSKGTAILDPNIDRAGRGASGPGRCDSSLVDFVAEFDLIDRYCLDHPGREMWTWLGSSPFGQVRSYLNRVLVRRADSDLVTRPTFHWLGRTGHKLVRVSLRLANRPNMAGNRNFNTSLLEIWDFRRRLENLIQRALVGLLPGISCGDPLSIVLGISPSKTVNSSN